MAIAAPLSSINFSQEAPGMGIEEYIAQMIQRANQQGVAPGTGVEALGYTAPSATFGSGATLGQLPLIEGVKGGQESITAQLAGGGGVSSQGPAGASVSSFMQPNNVGGVSQPSLPSAGMGTRSGSEVSLGGAPEDRVSGEMAAGLNLGDSLTNAGKAGKGLFEYLTGEPGQFAQSPVRSADVEGAYQGYRTGERQDYSTPTTPSLADLGSQGWGEFGSMPDYSGDALGGGIEPTLSGLEGSLPGGGGNWANFGLNLAGGAGGALINYLAGRYIDDPTLAGAAGIAGNVGTTAASQLAQTGATSLGGAAGGALGAIPALLGQYMAQRTGKEEYGHLGTIGSVAGGAVGAGLAAAAAPTAAATASAAAAGTTPFIAAAGPAAIGAGALVVLGGILSNKLGEAKKRKLEARQERSTTSTSTTDALMEALAGGMESPEAFQAMLGSQMGLGDIRDEYERDFLTPAEAEARWGNTPYVSYKPYTYDAEGGARFEGDAPNFNQTFNQETGTWDTAPTSQYMVTGHRYGNARVGDILGALSSSLGINSPYLSQYAGGFPQMGRINSPQELMAYSGMGQDQWSELLNYLNQSSQQGLPLG